MNIATNITSVMSAKKFSVGITMSCRG